MNADYQMIRLQERIAQLEQALAKLEVIQTFLPIILHKRKKVDAYSNLFSWKQNDSLIDSLKVVEELLGDDDGPDSLRRGLSSSFVEQTATLRANIEHTKESYRERIAALQAQVDDARLASELASDNDNNNSDDDDDNYELHAVMCHRGQAGVGHYWCFVKRDEQWFRCNDTVVEKVSWSVVENESFGHATLASQSSAYCLMYMSGRLAAESRAISEAELMSLHEPAIVAELFDEKSTLNQSSQF